MRESLFLIVLLFCVGAAGAQTFPPVQRYPEPSTLPEQYNLADPLVMLDGRKVEDGETWEKERRPELKRLFQHYMYGYMPGRPKEMEVVLEREDRAYFGGKAIRREVALKIPGLRPIHVLYIVPGSTRKVPVFVCISFVGAYAAVNDPLIPVSEGWQYPNRVGVVENRATEKGRGSAVDVWNIERTVERGYGVALFYNGDVEPDDKNSREGAHYRLTRSGGAEPDPNDWGAVAAWAWGAQRVVDFLLTQPEVDRKKIGVVGHSRNGKAALLAGAFDERIGLVISHQAGCGGSAPSRGLVGESVKQINTTFPHWFNANFKQFNDHPERLPFDQHLLAALCAPRPLLFSNAEQDTWANPAGQFEVLKAAEPAYRFLGAGGLAAETMPKVGELVNSRLGYFIRPGEHSMKRVDWDAFLEFADKRLGKPN